VIDVEFHITYVLYIVLESKCSVSGIICRLCFPLTIDNAIEVLLYLLSLHYCPDHEHVCTVRVCERERDRETRR
jgi:hypothetical protein